MGKGLTKCNRCGGMMVYEKIYYGTEHFWVWKCVYCGDYIDRVILENRQIQKSSREKCLKDNKELIYRPYSDVPSA
jgi:ssDNA-binding Zn-finger/Zn-ribbon topoisomerase 1